MSKFVTYIGNAYDELLHKVTWPTWKEIQETTGVVLVSILVLTALVFAMDALIRFVMGFIY
jgi:preprotein translocase subunit SecE